MATKSAGKTYLISNKRSGKVLRTTALGTVEQGTISYTDNELWITKKISGNVFKVINKASGMALDIVAHGMDNGTEVQVWEDVIDSETQLWELETASRGHKLVKNIYNQKVLDIRDLSDDDGAVIQVWDHVGGDNQEWKLAEYPVAVTKTVTKKKTTSVAKSKPAEAKKTTVAEEKAPAKTTTAKKPAATKTTTAKTTTKTPAKKAPAKKAAVKK